MPFGFAWSDATFASNREVAIPMDSSARCSFHAVMKMLSCLKRSAQQSMGTR